MVLRLGQTLGPLIMGFIFSLWGVNGVYFGGAVLAVTMFFIIIIMIKKQPGRPGLQKS